MAADPAPSHDPLDTEQHFVDSAYARLDSLRAQYQEQLKRAESHHGVGNPQGWAERDAITQHFSDLTRRLDAVEDRLVFGRLDPAADQPHYIGRIGLNTDDGTALLVDWRAPAAQAFYRATPLHPEGIVRRRHIQTRARRVTFIEDELLDSQAAKESHLELQGEGALMSALDQARDGRMGDIVATIQSEQDQIIRASGAGLLVVQGGPGTGKTAVALHRAAYLLYTERRRLEKSGVLIVGPSHVFLRYIEQVLPSLGETGVVSMTVGDLVPGIHAIDSESDAVARVKGKLAWAHVLKQAVHDLQKVPQDDQDLLVWNRHVTLTPQDVEEARTHARHLGKPHNVARQSFAMELIEVLARRLAEQSPGNQGMTPDSDEVSQWAEEVRASAQARRAINLCWLPTSAPTLLRRLYRRADLLAEVNRRARSHLSRKDLAAVQRDPEAPWSVQDVPLLDELEELLGPLPDRSGSTQTSEHQESVRHARQAMEAMGLGGGIVSADQLAQATQSGPEYSSLAERARADRSWTYGHIVVDEAQELSPMAWRALLRRCPSLSFTVVGDLDQRRGHDRPETWEQALGPASRALARQDVLTISYRTPATLTHLAEQVMARAGQPVRFPVTPVRDVEDAYQVSLVKSHMDADTPSTLVDPLRQATQDVIDAEIARLDERLGTGRGLVGVIVDQRHALAWGADQDGWSGLDHRVALLSATGAKGLEFDSVVLVEPSAIMEDGPGDLFVAMTRATQRMHVVASRPLPAGMDDF